MYGRNSVGPLVKPCDDLHAMKYRLQNESFEEAINRQAGVMSDDEEHRRAYKEITMDMRFLAAGRVQSAMGSPRDVTALNCFVSGTIEDSMDSIMQRASEAAETMRRGGGIGYDFSLIRPRGSRIVSLDSSASGPVSFMHIFDSVCRTIVSAGHRRGAMMGMLRVDHPDIEEFIRAKKNDKDLTNFNVSVAVTDEFMKAVEKDDSFDLQYKGEKHRTINARMLWDEIMRNNWDWAEPGVIFIDRVNEDNPLNYCETIAATNPCGEQPLPPFGACLLGSFNLVKYVEDDQFNFAKMKEDIPHIVRAMDNVIDRTKYPLEEQHRDHQDKRRMGLGITALANTFTLLGMSYGSPESIKLTKKIMQTLTHSAYEASSDLAVEKGSFPLYEEEGYMASGFISRLPKDLQDKIRKQGIRNSHLTSIAPTGTISFCADNVSSGIEPVFAHEYDRTVQLPEGPIVMKMKDYVWNMFEKKGEQTSDLTTDDHLNIQIAVQPFIDSACSKTINVGDAVTFAEFKEVYLKGWKGKLKGVTTFRLAGKRYGILNVSEEKDTDEGAACFIDPETGQKECG
jgi:ribonucleoside-diphosphate reductase alpha chain|tara:strand:+ start:8086 stop:9786 length:1701 start_codon:yes stop_codon:yes gene_type:complete